jgi:hypothetical protein
MLHLDVLIITILYFSSLTASAGKAFTTASGKKYFVANSAPMVRQFAHIYDLLATNIQFRIGTTGIIIAAALACALLSFSTMKNSWI